MSDRGGLVALAVAVILSGCGGANAPAPRSGITLDLKGGANETATACGASHHYAVFGAGRPVRFSGDVRPVPAGHWKVKVKVKICRSGSFADAVKTEATRDKRTGHFIGSIPAVGPSRYFARASLYQNGVVTRRGDKRYFVVRRR